MTELVVESEVELRIDQIIKMKEKIEDRMWRNRSFIKTAEVIGFAGTFLCTNPTGYLLSVILTAVAIICDFWLNYSEYRHQRDFQQLIV
jgi:hypothetical protein